jgi:hypothetical protein
MYRIMGAFNVQRSAFSVQRSTFNAQWRLAFGILAFGRSQERVATGIFIHGLILNLRPSMH